MRTMQRRTLARTALLAALLSGAAILSGCSTMDSINPFSSDEDAEPREAGQAAESEEEERQMLVAKGEENVGKLDTDVEDTGEYPNLATVPDAPEAGMSPNQRLIIEEGLLADRENAQYVAGPPPKLLPQPGGQMPAAPTQPVATADLPSSFGAQAPGNAGAPAPAPADDAPEQSATAPEPSAAAPANAQPLPPGEQVMLVSIRFPEGSTEAPAQADQVLEQVALIQKQENAFLRVVGHSRVGAADGDALSAERARLIASRIEAFGAAPDKVVAEGLGDSQPVAQGGGAQANRQNDRVEIFMIR